MENRVGVDLERARAATCRPSRRRGRTAIVVYTSGTTGPPKGAVLPRRALASNLDALAEAWEWTGDDVVAHALPLFHVHGLVLGMLGPLRRGGGMRHIGRFSAAAAAAALGGDATMLFGGPDDVPPARRRGRAGRRDRRGLRVRAAARVGLGRAPGRRPRADREAHRPADRRALRHDRDAHEHRRPRRRRAPSRLRRAAARRRRRCGWSATTASTIEDADDETIGEIHVRGPNLFLEYLNRPDATAEAMRDGWFNTGDLATRAPDGYIRIVGRRATDLIKSGGFKIGAGEIEGALLEHPASRRPR